MNMASAKRASIERSAGFSLAEMLVALAIVALVLGAAMPLMTARGKQNSPIDGARRIQQAFVAARVSAMSRARVETVSIDPAAGVLRSSVPGTPPLLLSSLWIELLVGQELVVSKEHVDVKFRPDGSSSGLEVTLGNKDGDRATISVNWLTGAVSVSDARNE